MGKKGREMFEERFTLKKFESNIAQIIQKTI